MKTYKRVFVEITNVCNLSCSFCPGTTRAPGIMPRPLFEKIVQQAAPLTEEFVLHILGEPLLHPDLLYFIDHILSYGLSVMLTTNGTLLRGQLADELAAKKIRQLNISLHCLPEITDKERYLEQVFSFARSSQQKDPEGYINLRLWNVLSEDNTWVLARLNRTFGTDLALPPESDRLLTKKSWPLEGRIYLHLDSRFSWPSLNGPALQERGFCYGMRSHIGILLDGTVVPCCLDSEGAVALGTITERPLKEILTSPQAIALKNSLNNGTLTEELCRRCGYIERFRDKGRKRKEEVLP